MQQQRDAPLHRRDFANCGPLIGLQLWRKNNIPAPHHHGTASFPVSSVPERHDSHDFEGEHRLSNQPLILG
jgi:hypothetical protein